MNKNEIILFETADNEVSLQVQMKDETVWLTRNQMAELFDRDVKTIGKHISNALKEELDGSTVAKFATVQTEGNREVQRSQTQLPRDSRLFHSRSYPSLTERPM